MEYIRDTQCEKCHLWYDESNLNDLGNGWLLCTICVEKLYPSDDEHGSYEDESINVEIVAHENALLTRTSAGLRVEACYLPLTGVTGVAVTLDGKQAWASCAPEQFLDAYHHPALYIGPEQCSKIGLR